MNIIQKTPPARAGSVDFVDGHTRLYGILGHPIEQVRSPETVTYELRQRGINAILLPIHIRPEDFDDALPGLLKLANLDGLVVTIPHKGSIIRHLHRIGPLAQISGSASVIGRSSDGKWVGEMFDGNGCVNAILRRGVELKGKRVLLLGAGGAGTGIAGALARLGVAHLAISDPDDSRRRNLIDRVGAACPDVELSSDVPDLQDIDVLINASPIGMLDETKMPIEVERIPSHVTVMDCIMDPDRTRLLSVAEASGCLTVYGREMLDAQIAAACDFLLQARTLPADEIRFP